MKYVLPTTNVDLTYLSLFTGLKLSGSLEQAGLIGDPEASWLVADYIENESLAQPLTLTCLSDMGRVLAPLAGALFVHDGKMSLHTSRPDHVLQAWWPFPAPVDSIYDELLEAPHIRPIPGRFDFVHEGVSGSTFRTRVTPLIKTAIIIGFYDFMHPLNGKGLSSLAQSITSLLSTSTKVTVGENYFNTVASSLDAQVKKSFDDFLASYMRYNDGDGKQVRVIESSVSSLDELVNILLDTSTRVGFRVQVSTPLLNIAQSESVSISSSDWRCYAHPFQPLAILEPKTVSGDPVESLSKYNGLYLRSDLAPQLPTTIPSGITNHIGSVYSKVGGFKTTAKTSSWDSFTETRLRLDDNIKIALETRQVVLRKSIDNSLHVVNLDIYEKWSLFPSNIRKIYAHWYTSGFLNQSYRENPVLLQTIGQIYRKNFNIENNDDNIYFHQPYAFLYDDFFNVTKITTTDTSKDFKPVVANLSPSMPSQIPLPEPVNYNYLEKVANGYISHKESGEYIGRNIRAIDYDFSQHKIHITEEHHTDYLTKSALRPYSTPEAFYAGNLGAYGLEEYAIRVPFTEIPNLIAINPFNNEAASDTLKNIELFKVKTILARTYHLGRSISLGLSKNTGSLSFSYSYNETRVKATNSWQVMSLGTYNCVVRAISDQGDGILSTDSSEAVRLLLEDVMYETWGEVFLHKGVIVEALFKGNVNGNKDVSGVRGDESDRKHHYNALRRVFSPANHSEGPGFGQNAGKEFVEHVGMSAHQMLHWYYYGVHVINAWGLGDCVTHFPTSSELNPDSTNAFDWSASVGASNTVPLPSLDVYADEGTWYLHNGNQVRKDNISGDDFRDDAEVWRLSRHFTSNEFDLINEPGTENQMFAIDRHLVFKLDRLRHHLAAQVTILDNSLTVSFLVESNGTKDYGKIELTNAIFEDNDFENSDIVADGGVITVYGSSVRVIARTDKKLINHDILDAHIGNSLWLEIVDESNKSHRYYIVK